MKKLLITLGPSTLNRDAIGALNEYSPYVYRLNMSHVPLDELAGNIRMIYAASNVPVCIDSEGAQIRTHAMAGGSALLVEGNEVELLSSPEEGTGERFSLTPFGIVEHFRPEDIVRLDWHGATLKIVSSGGGKAVAKVERGGIVASRKAVDVNRDVPLEPITAKDKEAIRIGREMNVRHFALSFANSAESVREFRALAGKNAVVISKLESMSALKNLRSIIMETDEALIDRGDLSRAVPLLMVPFLQMRIISIANILETPVFVATNLLETMITQNMPTRAELNDIVSSLLMGANGLVLAAETAAGANPVHSARLARELITLCRRWTPNASIDEILEMGI